MFIYIFEDIEKGLDDYAYHNGGGAAVVARDLEEAISLLPEDAQEPARDVWRNGSVTLYRLDAEHDPRAFIFVNAGCC